MNRCPTCRKELRSELVPADKDGDFTQIWRCPNAENHGTLVPCRNECGEMVPNPEYHYSYTKGLLGSGRWLCYKPLPPTCQVIVEHLPPEKDRPGFTAIRLGGDIICDSPLPCLLHTTQETE